LNETIFKNLYKTIFYGFIIKRDISPRPNLSVIGTDVSREIELISHVFRSNLNNGKTSQLEKIKKQLYEGQFAKLRS